MNARKKYIRSFGVKHPSGKERRMRLIRKIASQATIKEEEE